MDYEGILEDLKYMRLRALERIPAVNLSLQVKETLHIIAISEYIEYIQELLKSEEAYQRSM